MSKIKITPHVALVIFFLIFVLYYLENNVYSFAGNRIISLGIGGETFKAEVVSSDQKMQKGLGGRNHLCEKCGMLFEFQKAGTYSFWMKDMQIPLDIIWINEDKIVHIEKNVNPDFTGILVPDEIADKVLEINTGSADKLGIEIGDNVIF